MGEQADERGGAVPDGRGPGEGKCLVEEADFDDWFQEGQEGSEETPTDHLGISDD